MSVKLVFQERPNMGAVYWRVFTKRGNKLRAGEALPETTADWKGSPVEASRLAAYCAVCGFSADAGVPVTYPYIMAAPLHFAMLSDPGFPLAPMGGIHARNSILQHRQVRLGEALDIHCWVGGGRAVKAGLEFDVNTRIETGGSVVWECASGYIVRGRFGEPQDAAPKLRFGALESANYESGWKVAAGTGRRYAKVTGDYNPIHLHWTLGKLFGFPRDIIHGMWSLAKCASSLPALPADKPQRLDVAFKGPVLMGSSVSLKAATEGDKRLFEVYSGKNPKPVMQGQYRTAEAGETL